MPFSFDVDDRLEPVDRLKVVTFQSLNLEPSDHSQPQPRLPRLELRL